MVLTDDALCELIESTWGPSVGLPVTWASPADDAAFAHAATVRFTGGWAGHVRIDASDGFARALASVMFGLPESDVTDDDGRDALGEMANVLGGTVKGYAEDEVDLELPVTGDPGPQAGAGTVVATATCAHDDRPVRVQVCED